MPGLVLTDRFLPKVSLPPSLAVQPTLSFQVAPIAFHCTRESLRGS